MRLVHVDAKGDNQTMNTMTIMGSSAKLTSRGLYRICPSSTVTVVVLWVIVVPMVMTLVVDAFEMCQAVNGPVPASSNMPARHYKGHANRMNPDDYADDRKNNASEIVTAEDEKRKFPVCPTNHTCCFRPVGEDTSLAFSGCISDDMGALYATCCHDDPTTGCAVGFTCSISNTNSSTNNIGDVFDSVVPLSLKPPTTSPLTCNAGPTVTDPLVQVMPRYRLCSTSAIRHLYGFPVATMSRESNIKRRQDRSAHAMAETEQEIGSRDDDEHCHSRPPYLAYYSSHGNLYQPNDRNHLNNVTHVLVVIHGSLRNADSYLCSGVSVAMEAAAFSALPSVERGESVLVVAPRFAAWQDHDPALDDLHVFATTTSRKGDDDDEAQSPPPNQHHSALRWQDDGSGGPWRYGGDSSPPPVNTTSMNRTRCPKGAAFDTQRWIMSSFEALDQLLHHILHSGYLPRLEQVIVTGHSAGGQFVQRWALITSIGMDPEQNQQQHQPKQVALRTVVVNPSSYAYLISKRLDGASQDWVLPTDCVDYNSWEWGLNMSTTNSDGLSYIRHVVTSMGHRALLERFAHRHVFYMIGQQDRCTVPSETRDGWCYSHGLQTTCMDNWQGSQRFERHVRYMLSLQQVHLPDMYPPNRHVSVTVPGVGHDHSLMWCSEEGIQSLFGPLGGTSDGDGSDLQQEQQQRMSTIAQPQSVAQLAAESSAWITRVEQLDDHLQHFLTVALIAMMVIATVILTTNMLLRPVDHRPRRRSDYVSIP